MVWGEFNSDHNVASLKGEAFLIRVAQLPEHPHCLHVRFHFIFDILSQGH
jgi:hypothetical protein